MNTIRINIIDFLMIALQASGLMAIVWKLHAIISSIILIFKDTLLESFLIDSQEFIKWLTSLSILILTIIKIVKTSKSKRDEKHS